MDVIWLKIEAAELKGSEELWVFNLEVLLALISAAHDFPMSVWNLPDNEESSPKCILAGHYSNQMSKLVEHLSLRKCLPAVDWKKLSKTLPWSASKKVKWFNSTSKQGAKTIILYSTICPQWKDYKQSYDPYNHWRACILFFRTRRV